MGDFRSLVRRIVQPTFAIGYRVWIHIAYRFIVSISAILIAQILGKITQAISVNAPFDHIVSIGTEAFLIIGFNLVALAIMVYFSATQNDVAVRTSRVIRQQLLEEYFKKEISIQTPTGKVLTIFENGLSSWLTLSNRAVIDDPYCIVTFFIGFGYLVYTDIGLLPIALGYMAVIAAIAYVVQVKVKPHREERRKSKEDGGRVFVRAIMEKSTALMNGAFAYELKRLSAASDRVVLASQKVAAITAPGYRLPGYLLDIVRICTTLFLAYRITQGTANIGDIVSVGLVFVILDNYFGRLLDSYQIYTDEYITLQRLWDFLDKIPNFERLTKGDEFVSKTGGIVFKEVDFVYPGNESPTIKKLSCVLPAGKKTALVGRSGAGKSTIVKMILGLLLPSSGKLLIDGQDLSKIKLESYFPYIGYLPQDPSVFDGTIRENLAYGIVAQHTDAELLKALEYARCDFVSDMKLGLDTEIGERGIRLSGGERQRLAIARIFLRNPEILILDEPTSALDSFSEAAITEALKELFKNKTVIVVAHRLQTVKEADTIFVLKSGAVVEQGTHESLLAQDGEYAHMVDLQSGKMIENNS